MMMEVVLNIAEYHPMMPHCTLQSMANRLLDKFQSDCTN